MNSAPGNTTVESRHLAAQPVVSIRAVIPIDQLEAVMGTRIEALSDYLRQIGAPPAGPVFVRYHTFGPTDTDIETGVPVAVPVTGAGPIRGGMLPGGPTISTWHFGPHPRLGEAYARLEAWLQTQGRAAAGPPWEIYHWLDLRRDPAEQDHTQWGTQLVQPIE
jgi:effector-binding domain-containing protein